PLGPWSNVPRRGGPSPAARGRAKSGADEGSFQRSRSQAMAQVIQNYIGGKAVAGTSGRRGKIFNPAIGEVVREGAFSTAADLDAAVAAAKAAFPAWAATPPLRRARLMFRLKQLIEQNMDRLARIITEEHGKTVDDAKGSITRGLEVVEFACGI